MHREFGRQFACLGNPFLFPRKKSHDDEKEYGSQENAEESYSKHSTENRGAQGLPHFRAGTHCVNQRNHPERERERSHQDWAQA